MNRKIILMITALLLCAAFLSAQTPESIIRRLEKNIVHSSARIEGSMTVTDRFGAKTTSFISWTEGEDNVLIEFTSVEEEGQKILRTADELYLFYPDAEELIRLRGAALRDSVLGSDMSYEDLTGGKGILESYTVSLEGVEPVEGKACYKLILTAKARNVPYPKQVLWVDQDVYVYRRMEQYALSGRLLKELRVTETAQVEGKTVPTKMVITDAMKKQSSTEFTILDIQIGIALPANLFSLQELTW